MHHHDPAIRRHPRVDLGIPALGVGAEHHGLAQLVQEVVGVYEGIGDLIL